MISFTQAIARTMRTALGRGSSAPAAAPPLLDPLPAYERWAPNYGAPLSPLHHIEASARAPLMPALRGARVLDLGCGTGRIATEAREAGARQVVGIDASRPMLRRAASSAAPSVALVAGDACRLPFRDAGFDAVIGALVLGHVPDLAGALGEAARVLAPGGALVLSDFHPRATLRGWERTFEEAGTGRTFRVRHHPHPLERYAARLQALGLAVEDLVEPEHDGTPVVFVLRARKEG